MEPDIPRPKSKVAQHFFDLPLPDPRREGRLYSWHVHDIRNKMIEYLEELSTRHNVVTYTETQNNAYPGTVFVFYDTNMQEVGRVELRP